VVFFVSWDDATTVFSEGMGMLFMDCVQMSYRLLSITTVAELHVPSQILERWLVRNSQVLNRFALHYKTNEPFHCADVKASL
jgi:Zn-dependent oligopeptidase